MIPNKLRVLIVDDSLIIRTKLKKYIESIGHQVVSTSKTGREGIHAAKEFKPDLITMDINMPDMDGVEAVKAIKKEDLDTDIVMVTVLGGEETVIYALSVGATGYLLKPLVVDKIKELLDELYNKKLEKIRKTS